MPAELAAKLRAAEKFNQSYALPELLGAAELDMGICCRGTAPGRAA